MSLFPDYSLSHQIDHLIWGNLRSSEVTQTELTRRLSVSCVGTLMPGIFYYYKALQSEAVKILLSQPVSEPPLCL